MITLHLVSTLPLRVSSQVHIQFICIKYESPHPLMILLLPQGAEHCGWIATCFLLGVAALTSQTLSTSALDFSRFHLWTLLLGLCIILWRRTLPDPGGPHLSFLKSTSSWADSPVPSTGHSLCCWKKCVITRENVTDMMYRWCRKWGIVTKSNKHSQIRLPHLCFLKSQIPSWGTDLSPVAFSTTPSPSYICLWLNSAFPCQLKMIN